MKKQKRGRPKGSTSKGEPTNYIFWKGILRDNKIQEFVDKGTKVQKGTIKSVLNYLKSMEPEFFEQVNGKQILKQL